MAVTLNLFEVAKICKSFVHSLKKAVISQGEKLWLSFHARTNWYVEVMKGKFKKYNRVIKYSASEAIWMTVPRYHKEEGMVRIFHANPN